MVVGGLGGGSRERELEVGDGGGRGREFYLRKFICYAYMFVRNKIQHWIKKVNKICSIFLTFRLIVKNQT